MSSFKIQGGKTLHGSIPVYGSKNAALPLLAASLLSSEKVTLQNIPAIADVTKLLQIMKVMDVEIQEEGANITVQSANIDPEQLPAELVGHLRGSILLLGSLLGRFRKVRLPLPGGDIIGARPIDVHLDAFRQLGAHIQQEHSVVTIDGSELTAGVVTLREASVTATENVMMVAAALPGTTTINIAAQEPHIVVLAELLNNMGATVSGAGTHTITIEGTDQWQAATIINIPDMLEAGLFLLLGAVTESPITVEHVPKKFLHLFFKKLEDIGIGWKEQGDSVTVQPGPLSSFKVQTLPYPGIATDLQAPFSVIATQAAGASLIHDPMYESRFRHCDELIKMGAAITVCDPHRVIIEGPTPLAGRHIKSLDIRSGATLIMAGLVATGETIIDDAEIIDRGYANLVERLQALGADIERCE